MRTALDNDLHRRQAPPADDGWIFVRTPRKSALRKVAFAIHKWLGLIAAVYMLVMSVTGVSLVFHDDMSEILNPPTVTAPGPKSTTSLNRVRTNVERAFPEYTVTGIIAPARRDRAFDVFAAPKAAGDSIKVEVDPYTGEVLGIKRENEVLKFLRQLHFNLLNGKTGRLLNGIGALALIVVTITGMIVWWRGIDNNWLSGFRVRLRGSLRLVIWNLHSTVGAWTVPLLLIWGISGFYFGFPDEFEKSLNTMFAVSSQRSIPNAPNVQSPQMPISGAALELNLDLDRLAATALSSVPEGTAVQRIALPDKRRNFVRLWMRVPGSDNPTQVYINQNTGKVFAISKGESPPSGDMILQWLMRLHFGTFLGTTSKCIWLLVGLIPAALSLSALYLFWSGLMKRRTSR